MPRKPGNPEPDDPVIVIVNRGQSRKPPVIPTASERWCPQAQSWYRSLALSGQADFYEASDWATAICAAEAYDIFFKTHNASTLGSFVRLSERLGATITDRKRSRIDLEAPEPADEDEKAADKAVIDWHHRLGVVRELQSGEADPAGRWQIRSRVRSQRCSGYSGRLRSQSGVHDKGGSSSDRSGASEGPSEYPAHSGSAPGRPRTDSSALYNGPEEARGSG